MNALMLLKSDHRTVEGLFSQFEELGESARGKKQLAQKIIKELAIHAAIEEQIFYPAVRRAVRDANDKVLESLEEHHIVKWQLSELQGMEPDDERFDAKMNVLMENVRHHVKEEEKELFPKVREHIDAKELKTLGDQLERAKRTAPTRPHPRAPDTPPGNVVAGLGAAMLDRARDGARGMMQKVASPRARQQPSQLNRVGRMPSKTTGAQGGRTAGRGGAAKKKSTRGTKRASARR